MLNLEIRAQFPSLVVKKSANCSMFVHPKDCTVSYNEHTVERVSKLAF